MNTKKIVAMIIALIMTTATFAGCGNNTVDHKDTEVSSTVETTIDKDVDKTVEEESDEKSETAEKANATETADKKNSKETSNKAEKPNDNKVADKSDKDKGSVQANSNSSVSKPNSGNANNNGSASKPSTPAKPNKPSGNNSGSSNNGNHNGSVNKPSKPVEKPVEKPSEPQKPAPHVHHYNTVVSSTNGDCSHVGKVTKKCSCGATVTENGSYGDHKWENQYTEVHHDAKYEERPVYKWVGYHECRKCGFQTEDDDAILLHCFDCGGTYTTKEKQVQTGTESVQVEKAWTEQVPDGKKCTICGTHNH